MALFIRLMVGVSVLVVSTLTHSAYNTKDIPQGFYQVAKEEKVPVKILWAMALNESQAKTNYGRVIAWKYAMNHKGKGYYFLTAEDLIKKAKSLLAAGDKNFDVGIGQINYRYHGHNFLSLEEMVNPYNNLKYAASYLKSHLKDKGDWWDAVGKYHSPANGKHAEKYRKLVKKIWLEL